MAHSQDLGLMQAKYMVIAGPTGVGKTDLAIEVAQRLRTEIVGADAFQIYQGLDLLTGKPHPSQLRSVRHHLVSIVPLTETFDAHRYAILARQIILDLNQRGTIPLVVGGTGFYLRALEQPLPRLPSANKDLRQELEQRSTSILLEELALRDPVTLARIDRRNRRRLVRALEICILSDQPFSSFTFDPLPAPTVPRLFLQRTRQEMDERIYRRVTGMFARGVAGEVAQIRQIGPTASQAIGFSLIRALLAGDIDEESCHDQICRQTRQYAKRQTTWFRRQKYQFVSAESAVECLTATFRRHFSEGS